MTDRVKGFTVTLKDDVRIDDIEQLQNAILCMKGVIDVEPSIADHNDHMNRERVKWELYEKIQNFLSDILKN